jgi:hypothetical protein
MIRYVGGKCEKIFSVTDEMFSNVLAAEFFYSCYDLKCNSSSLSLYTVKQNPACGECGDHDVRPSGLSFLVTPNCSGILSSAELYCLYSVQCIISYKFCTVTLYYQAFRLEDHMYSPIPASVAVRYLMMVSLSRL